MEMIERRAGARRVNSQHQHHIYEDIVLGDDSSLKDHDKKKRQSMDVPLWVWIVIAIFVSSGLLLGDFLLHHRHRKVALHVIRHPWAHGGAALRMVATRKRHNRDGFHHHFYSGSPRFVTVVMPSVVNPDNRAQRLEAIHDTWGPYARALYVLHNSSEFPKASHLTISENSRPKDQYLYPQNLLLPSTIHVEDGIPRLIYTIQTIYHEKNPEFAFFVNDHTFVIPEHLCKFLDERDPNRDLYAGHALKNGQDIFNSGAAGYILSRETMRKLVFKWNEKDPECWVDENTPNKQKKWLQGNPGLVVVSCLKSMGIVAIDTREKAPSSSGHVFHAFPLTRVVTGAVDDWYRNKHKFEELPDLVRRGFDNSYSTLETGPQCCAAETVSFHYVEYMENKALFRVRGALRDETHMTDPKLKGLMMEEWPVDFKDIGGYSRGLPKADDAEGWSQLLATMRKISVRRAEEYC